jgi:hypothetical protein
MRSAPHRSNEFESPVSGRAGCSGGERFYQVKQRGGEGGIRTLGTLLGYGALAKRCFRPLSHLTKNRLREYREELWIANIDIRRRLRFIGVVDCRLTNVAENIRG